VKETCARYGSVTWYVARVTRFPRAQARAAVPTRALSVHASRERIASIVDATGRLASSRETPSRECFAIPRTNPSGRAGFLLRAAFDRAASTARERHPRRFFSSPHALTSRVRTCTKTSRVFLAQGYWVTESYLLSCFAHFGASTSPDSRISLDPRRDVDGFFFQCRFFEVFLHAARHRTRESFRQFANSPIRQVGLRLVPTRTREAPRVFFRENRKPNAPPDPDANRASIAFESPHARADSLARTRGRPSQPPR